MLKTIRPYVTTHNFMRGTQGRYIPDIMTAFENNPGKCLLLLAPWPIPSGDEYSVDVWLTYNIARSTNHPDSGATISTNKNGNTVITNTDYGRKFTLTENPSTHELVFEVGDTKHLGDPNGTPEQRDDFRLSFSRFVPMYHLWIAQKINAGLDYPVLGLMDISNPKRWVFKFSDH